MEDNPGDVRLTQEAVKDGKVLSNLNMVEDGAKAVDFLRRAGRYADVPRPDLILLDLNLPQKDGREVQGRNQTRPKPETHPGGGLDYLQG